MYDSMCKFAERIRWKAYWYSKKGDESTEDNTSGSFKFPTKRSAPYCTLLQPFENDLFEMVKNIKFRNARSEFQAKLRKDVRHIDGSKNLFVLSDKTSNIYEVKPDDYRKLLKENITRDYVKDSESTIKAINNEASRLVGKAEISGRIPKYSTAPAFLTIKDHKEGFPNIVKCRLVNPAKSHIGKVSKHLLDKIIVDVRRKSNLVQWKNAYEVTRWFERIEDKSNKCFIKFDIVEFYPSIKEEQLRQALNFAREYSDISEQDEEIIFHSCKTVLIDTEGNVWRKKNTSLFDIAMGSYHGAEVCDLIGLYILSKLQPILGDGTHGLYRDDGLAVLTGRSPPEWERTKKTIQSTFSSVGFKVTVEAGLYQTDFLDVILDLRKDEFRPFRKPNSRTTYINNGSNHPRYIRNALPTMTCKRISGLSKNEAIYDKYREPYDEALVASNLKKMDAYIQGAKKPAKKRRRSVLYFHPPYCASVATKVGKVFLRLVDKHFPRGHKLRPIFNRNTLKISYSALPNVKSALQRHNHKVLRTEKSVALCNCRKRACPVDGKCLTKGVVYKATVSTSNEVKEYIGSTCDTFKSRYNNHLSSFKNPPKKATTTKEDGGGSDEHSDGDEKATAKTKENATKEKATTTKRKGTALARHIHKLKNEGTDYNIKWEFMYKHGVSERPEGRLCAVCNLERFAIAMADKKKSLNKRSELTSKCQHQKSCYL